MPTRCLPMSTSRSGRRRGGVVVALHGRRGHRRVPYVRGAAKRWSRDGLAVVAIDAPYHGERALDQIPDLARNEPFLTQTVGDLRRLTSAIGSDRRLADLPIGYLGFSMGVLVGVPFMAVDRESVPASLRSVERPGPEPPTPPRTLPSSGTDPFSW